MNLTWVSFSSVQVLFLNFPPKALFINKHKMSLCLRQDHPSG